jgi:hypothetical protein
MTTFLFLLAALGVLVLVLSLSKALKDERRHRAERRAKHVEQDVPDPSDDAD